MSACNTIWGCVTLKINVVCTQLAPHTHCSAKQGCENIQGNNYTVFL